VFAASDAELDRRVAVKLLAERFVDDEGVRARFEREALAATRLSGHPNVVTIYDVGEQDGRPFIVMELIPGGTVADRIERGDVSVDESLRWLEQTAAALDAAHAEGILHRDVKPANLLLNARGDVHVADFGIARVLDETAGLTETGAVIGTVGYLSPEQVAGERATTASDVYALGAVAYELLTGRRPFEREAPAAEATAHLQSPVPSASAAVGLPPAVDAVLERALAKDPAARFASAGALAAELRAATAADEGPTRVLSAPTRVLTAATTLPLRSVVQQRPRWLVPVVVALALLLLGGIVGAVLAGGGGGKTTSRKVHTVTQTLPGTTVSQTVTQPVAPPAPSAKPKGPKEQPRPRHEHGHGRGKKSKNHGP